MSLIWDTAQGSIWFARWDDPNTRLRLYVVVEGVPESNEWDWEVWLRDEPKIVKSGLARSVREASAAAREAAEECLTTSGASIKELRQRR